MRLSRSVPLVGVLALLAITPTAFAQVFKAGNLVVSRELNTTGVFDAEAAAPIYLDEYTFAGTLLNSLLLPTPNAAGTTGISGSFNSKSEGAVMRSLDGHYLTIMGYSAPVTGMVGNISNTESSQYERLVARIDAAGNVDTSTRLTDAYSGDNPRAVLSINGTQFYMVGNAANGPDINTLGIRYTKLGSTTSQILGTVKGGSLATNPPAKPDNLRAVGIYNGNLYVVKGSGGKGGYGIFEVNYPAGGVPGDTIPLPAPGTAYKDVTLPGLSWPAQQSLTTDHNPFGFFFANPTTVYLADEGYTSIDNSNPLAPDGIVTSFGGIQKYSLVNGTWQLDYILRNGLVTAAPGEYHVTGIDTGIRNITAEVVGNTVKLFGITALSGEGDPDALVSITDSLSATTLPAGESFTTLATSGPTSLFRGVAFTPVPEAGSLPLLAAGLAGLVLLARRRNRASQ